MPSLLAIGDFARATHLSVKTLRHYHESGLLEPAEVDPQTGYRRYAADQISTAQIIRRFRDLDMPLNEIHAVLAAPDLPARNDLIAAHLSRLEGNLSRTQSAVASLRDLLQHPSSSPRIEHRSIPATASAAITEIVDTKDALSWYQGALGELRATLAAQHLKPAGPAGGIFSSALFSDGLGAATIFIPCGGAVRLLGRVRPLVVPAIEVAMIQHAGAHTNIDLAYGALARYVAHHTLAVEGPIREYYVVGAHDTPDESSWLTEIGWPIFETRDGASTLPARSFIS
ncbi:MAG TPA: MerR family transcriptional regulator [Thermoanaerobaculia bacterium]|jgi:DNA-binding transcriptional MerR regulator|nr:MerR family transcriptional regulator [Thermoanaerobaculia bacterium]